MYHPDRERLHRSLAPATKWDTMRHHGTDDTHRLSRRPLAAPFTGTCYAPRSFRFAPAHNDSWRTAGRQIIDIAPDLLLIGGDLTHDGTRAGGGHVWGC